jgi:hypothetical protein
MSGAQVLPCGTDGGRHAATVSAMIERLKR